MNSQVIQEFTERRFKAIITPSLTPIVWESQRLSVMFPSPDLPKGSDRMICNTVNGVLRVSFLDKSVLSLPDFQSCTIRAGLFGEYANLSGAINYATFTMNDSQYYQNGILTLPLFQSYANLMQNIFLRFAFYPYEDLVVEPTPLELSFTGALLGSRARF